MAKKVRSATTYSKATTTNPKDILGMRKPSIHLIPAAGIIHQSIPHLDGAMKYGPYNWRAKKVRMTVYIAAAQRHLLELLDGADWVQDSANGAHHAGAVIACMNIILDAKETGNLIDDRPIKGPASKLIVKYTRK